MVIFHSYVVVMLVYQRVNYDINPHALTWQYCQSRSITAQFWASPLPASRISFDHALPR